MGPKSGCLIPLFSSLFDNYVLFCSIKIHSFRSSQQGFSYMFNSHRANQVQCGGNETAVPALLHHPCHPLGGLLLLPRYEQQGQRRSRKSSLHLCFTTHFEFKLLTPSQSVSFLLNLPALKLLKTLLLKHSLFQLNLFQILINLL